MVSLSRVASTPMGRSSVFWRKRRPEAWSVTVLICVARGSLKVAVVLERVLTRVAGILGLAVPGGLSVGGMSFMPQLSSVSYFYKN